MSDISARKVIATLKTGSRPYTVALAKGRIFAANQHGDSVSVFDASTLKPAGEIRVGEYPEGVAASRDGAAILVANWFSNELWRIDAATLEVVGKSATAMDHGLSAHLSGPFPDEHWTAPPADAIRGARY